MHHALPLTIINSVKQQIFTFIAISLKSKSKDFDAHKHLEILHTQIEYIEQFKKLLIQKQTSYVKNNKYHDLQSLL